MSHFLTVSRVCTAEALPRMGACPGAAPHPPLPLLSHQLILFEFVCFSPALESAASLVDLLLFSLPAAHVGEGCSRARWGMQGQSSIASRRLN